MITTDLLSPEAPTQFAVWPGVRGLASGGSLLSRCPEGMGYTVFAMAGADHDMRCLLALQDITPFWTCPEAAPTDLCQFDVVFSHQSFHLFNPGQALSEIARVLRPGGCFSAPYVIRDNSVPWVWRFTAPPRRYDLMAMCDDYSHASLAVMGGSKYSPEVEHHAFRVWQAISLDDLQQLVVSQPLSRRLSEVQHKHLADGIKTLFEQPVRPGGNLRLPFQLLAWWAWVNHDELIEPVSMSESGIEIDIQVATPLWQP